MSKSKRIYRFQYAVWIFSILMALLLLAWRSDTGFARMPDLQDSAESNLALIQGKMLPPDTAEFSSTQAIGPQFPERTHSPQTLSGNIAFESDRNGVYDLFAKDADGARRTIPQVSSIGNDVTPVWSPDGAEMLFASDRDGDFDVYRRTADSQEIKLTFNSNNDIHPSWSPSGDRILFASDRSSSYFQIYSMRPDGNDVRLVAAVSGQNVVYPHFSPDGRRISYMQASVMSPICQWNWDVWVMDAGGGNRRQVTTNLAGDLYPRWTPDGSELVYGACKNFLDADLYAINPDTGNEYQLNSWFLSNEWGAIFSPDVEHMAFNTDVEGDIEIYIATFATSTASNFTQHSADDLAASWGGQQAPMINHAPYTPSDPIPYDGSSGVTGFGMLQWSGGDPDIGDQVTYDIYFGTVNPPPLVKSNHNEDSYFATISPNNVYFWRIIAHDNHGASAEGPVWTFDTLPPTYGISGHVRNGVIGDAIAGVRISNGAGQAATTDSSGNYVIMGMPAGTYTISASLPDWTFAPDPLPSLKQIQPAVITVPPNQGAVDFNGYDREPIVFVHGWQGGFDPFCPNHDIQFFDDMDEYFASVDDDLENAGYYTRHASLMTWTCWTASLDDNAVQVKDAIDRARAATGRDKVILIGHSMGGLVSRAYIESDLFKQEGNRDVSRLFTFGSPHLGVPADIMAVLIGGNMGALGLGVYCGFYGPAVCEFTTTGMLGFNFSHSSQNDVEYYLVSGSAKPWKLEAIGLLAYSALGGWTGVGNDAAVQQISGIGLLGSHHRLRTDEAHRISVGDPNYFSHRDEGGSRSYNECLSPVLLNDDGTTCGEPSMLVSAARPQDTFTTSHSPMQYGILLPTQSSDHEITLEGGFSLIATRWMTGTLEVSLIDPHGTVIDPTYAANHPDQVTFDANEGIAIYSLTDTEAGVWQVRLQAEEGIPDEGTGYSLMAVFDSALNVSAESDRMWYTPGETATLSVRIDPAPATAVVSTTILLADGGAEMVELTTVGGDQYRGVFTVPNVSGYTEARFIASGDTANGNAFERGQSIVFQISPTTVAFTGVYGDTPQPHFAGSNYYQTLDVSVGIDVSTATTVTLSADLVDAVGATVAHAITTSAVNPDDTSLTLRLSGDDIYSSRTNGPYTVTHVFLTDKSGITLALAQADDVYTTPAYDYQRFAAGVVYLPTLMK